jgi:Fic family protein
MRLPLKPPALMALFDNEKDEQKQATTNRLFKMLTGDLGKDLGSEYLHWDKLRYKPLPEGPENHEEWWFLIKVRRASAYRNLPLLSTDGTPFKYWLPDPIQLRLHAIDQQASGRVGIAEEVTNPSTRDRYLVNSLIEEAITSSQLEGASTSHKVAKTMLRENREPRDRGERMIYNNYRAMEFIREAAGEILTKELLLELHKIVTDQTLNDPTAEGRFRTQDDLVAVHDNRDNVLLYEPPDAGEMDQRIKRICKFANTKNKGGEFLHPVAKAIILHFMIGYDHPFVDGNGRTARALFYWSMAKHGYWMMEYVSISTILKSGWAKYARAYLYSENDDNDVTYFIDHNSRVLIRAIENLQNYLARKVEEVKQVENVLSSSMLSRELNYRQLALISHMLRNPGEIYTIESHRNSHGIAYPTARGDLLKLVDFGLLSKRKVSKAFAFRAIANVSERLEELKAEFA